MFPMSKPFVLNRILSVAACKGTRHLLRILKRGGTALPGKVAMKLCPDILPAVSEGMEIIVVTGTNGKTTTSGMIEQSLTASGKTVLANKSGANLLSGVTAEFACASTAVGKPRFRYAVIECDEGALKQVVPRIRPKVIVVTNLFRDQLDRYGEVMHTRDEVLEGIKKVPECTLVLNADDSLTASIALDVPNKVVWYGLSVPGSEDTTVGLSDATHCIRCGAEYRYRFHTYAHLGAFFCPECGYERPEPEVSVTEISHMAGAGTDALLQEGKTSAVPGSGTPEPVTRSIHVALPAVYNLYNAVAAIAAYRAAGYDEEEMIRALATVRSSFGRMESFDFGERKVQCILVKNPAGCNQAVDFVTSLSDPYVLVLALNDQTADGHDISWIWDVNYEKFAGSRNLSAVYIAGDRAEDMLLRMKYAGVPTEKLILEKDYGRLLDMMKDTSESGSFHGIRSVFCMPNYTSMLTLRTLLGEATGKNAYWERQA